MKVLNYFSFLIVFFLKILPEKFKEAN
jgi:hypothetical protein